jgi:nucleoside 2-deoxyribosyltransferase
MPILLYLASPYSHGDWKARNDRYLAVCDMAGKLMARGFHVFSPIAACYQSAVMHQLPKGFEYWRDFDLRMMRACDAVYVHQIDGWDTSVGVADELEYAKALGLPVYCNEDELP